MIEMLASPTQANSNAPTATDHCAVGKRRRSPAARRLRGKRPKRAAFTLVELLVVITIISILASTVLFALYEVLEQAKEARTQAQIARIDELIMQKYMSYQTRSLPMRVPAATNPTTVSGLRLLAIRELMRMELPDRKTDLIFGAVTLKQPGSGSPGTPLNVSLWRSYRRRAAKAVRLRHGPSADWTQESTWSGAHQGAECLYMIMASLKDGEKSGLDFFKETEIGDEDDDGMLEIQDGWGRPIEFLRWAPGFATLPGPDFVWGTPNGGSSGNGDDDDNGVIDDEFEMGWPGSDDGSDFQRRDPVGSPDPFDPLNVDPALRAALNLSPTPTFSLYPLIFSAGQDQLYDIATELSTPPLAYATTPLLNDPYHTDTASGAPRQLGQPSDPPLGGNGVLNSIDNITNHLLISE